MKVSGNYYVDNFISQEVIMSTTNTTTPHHHLTGFFAGTAKNAFSAKFDSFDSKYITRPGYFLRFVNEIVKYDI